TSKRFVVPNLKSFVMSNAARYSGRHYSLHYKALATISLDDQVTGLRCVLEPIRFRPMVDQSWPQIRWSVPPCLLAPGVSRVTYHRPLRWFVLLESAPAGSLPSVCRRPLDPSVQRVLDPGSCYQPGLDRLGNRRSNLLLNRFSRTLRPTVGRCHPGRSVRQYQLPWHLLPRPGLWPRLHRYGYHRKR